MMQTASAHSGARMDRQLPGITTWRTRRAGLLVMALAVPIAAFCLGWRPARMDKVESPQLAPVVMGIFRDELQLRARVEPVRSVQLDAPEAGRVEMVFARDGDWVAVDAPLYQLRSPEQEQQFMQRSAEVAQQLANVSIQRSAQVASMAQNRRELAQLQTAQLQADSEYQRSAKLAAAGFLSVAALEQAQRQKDLAAELLEQARRDQKLESSTRQQSLDEMARAVHGLQHGLQLLESARNRLQQRAPIAGRLRGFQLQVGTGVRTGDRLGRIDDPSGGMQLNATVDEYYLPRLGKGQKATSDAGELTVAQTLPQVQDGKVTVLLQWSSAAARRDDLRPGQAVDIRLQLSAPTRALLLADGPGVQTQLYVREGRHLTRRTVRLGRRAAGQVEVLAGLLAGEQVLISQPPSNTARIALP